MNITFHGAAHQVTGSCHIITTKTKKILLDCGMFQGSKHNEDRNQEDFPFDPKEIDAVIISHAHLDHTGRVPKLVRDGFTGDIYMTKPTIELSKLIWNDTLHIMRYNNKKFKESILFQEEDIDAAEQLCVGVDYNQKMMIDENISFVLKDAGHIFGSAFIELTADGKTLGFTGDLGNSNVPILREADQLGAVDFLLSEATYGDRVHDNTKTREEVILQHIKEGVEKGGTIMMPAFSLERTQELLYVLNDLSEQGLLPKIPIYLDSPLSIRALPTYKKYPQYYDEEAAAKYRAGDDFLNFPGLEITEDREASIQINEAPNPKMIIAGSGMMTGGRILHHAKRYLSDPKSTLILAGYQAEGTIGRQLFEGAKTVRIHEEDIPVACDIKMISVLSGHADQTKLLSWVKHAEALPKTIYCVHGEHGASEVLAEKYKNDLGIESFVAKEGDTVEV